MCLYLGVASYHLQQAQLQLYYTHFSKRLCNRLHYFPSAWFKFLSLPDLRAARWGQLGWCKRWKTTEFDWSARTCDRLLLSDADANALFSSPYLTKIYNSHLETDANWTESKNWSAKLHQEHSTAHIHFPPIIWRPSKKRSPRPDIDSIFVCLGHLLGSGCRVREMQLSVIVLHK